MTTNTNLSTQLVAQLYVQGVIPAQKLSAAARTLNLKLDELLSAIEVHGIDRQTVYWEATMGSPVTATASQPWQTFTLDEAIEVLYNRAASKNEIAAKIGKTPKAVANFRWRAFTQGFIVPKELWEALQNGNEALIKKYRWRGEFAKMLYELAHYAKIRKLPPPKIHLT